jgi:hypothetical protein
VRPVCAPILLAVFSWPWIAAADLGAREIALAATIAIVLIAGFGLWLTMRGIRDQLWLQTFQEYTRRYSEMFVTSRATAGGRGVASVSTRWTPMSTVEC